MAAERALKLALGALAGAHTLTPDEVRRRIAGRYPEAAPLPDRPALDALLQDAGSELRWKSEAGNGRGAYESPFRSFVTVASETRYTRSAGRASHGLQRRAPRIGARPTTSTSGLRAPWRIERSWRSPCRRAGWRRRNEHWRRVFAIDARSMDELVIRHMKAAAAEAGADWQVVLRADRGPRDGSDWANLLRLVGHRALPRVRAELAAAQRPVLLANLGLLARYEQMSFLDDLRDATGRPGGPPGVWLLVPSDAQESRPLIDGKPVPVFTAAQWARIPGSWLAGRRPDRCGPRPFAVN